MTKSTVSRILTIFTDIIPSAPRSISTNEILQRILDIGYKTTKSQLCRDLQNYSDQFGVIECGMQDGMLLWQRMGRSHEEPKMSDAEMMLYSVLKDQLDDFLPAPVRELIEKKLERSAQQRKYLMKNVPQHKMFKWEYNRTLILKHKELGRVSEAVLKAAAKSLNDKVLFRCVSEDKQEPSGILYPLELLERDGELWIRGIPDSHSDQRQEYCLSKLKTASCVTQNEAYERSMPSARR